MHFEDRLDLGRQNRQSADRVNDWAARQPFLFGPNYVSRNAASQLEFWSKEGFKPKIIFEELSGAAALGINTLRVNLHDSIFKYDKKGFGQRINTFLDITATLGIKPMLTVFDSCWKRKPRYGIYPAPVPGVHNSQWVQSPGVPILMNPGKFAELQGYIEWIVAFASDKRSLGLLDLWNEPDNQGGMETGTAFQENRADLIAPLLAWTFEVAQRANPDLLLTSGLWGGACAEMERDGQLNPVQRVQRACSDVATFHNYDANPNDFLARIDWLKIDDRGDTRPVMCSEWMARFGFEPGHSNSIETLLSATKEHGALGSMPWGLRTGKTQTNIPWDNHFTGTPHHDLMHGNGKLYYPIEGEIIREVMAGETFALARAKYEKGHFLLQAVAGRPLQEIYASASV